MKTVAKWLGFKTPKVKPPPTPTANIVATKEEAREAAMEERKKRRRMAGRGGGITGTEFSDDWKNQILGGPDSQGGFR